MKGAPASCDGLGPDPSFERTGLEPLVSLRSVSARLARRSPRIRWAT
jgi:hypothetical protein